MSVSFKAMLTGYIRVESVLSLFYFFFFFFFFFFFLGGGGGGWDGGGGWGRGGLNRFGPVSGG